MLLLSPSLHPPLFTPVPGSFRRSAAIHAMCPALWQRAVPWSVPSARLRRYLTLLQLVPSLPPCKGGSLAPPTVQVLRAWRHRWAHLTFVQCPPPQVPSSLPWWLPQLWQQGLAPCLLPLSHPCAAPWLQLWCVAVVCVHCAVSCSTSTCAPRVRASNVPTLCVCSCVSTSPSPKCAGEVRCGRVCRRH